MKSIQKSSPKLRKSIKDLDLKSKESRGIVQMKGNYDDSTEIVTTQKKNETSEELIQEYNTVKNYNDNITNHPEPIKRFKPTDLVLIRYYRRLPYLTVDGNLVNTPTPDDYAKVTKRADSGQIYALKEIPVQFSFDNKAVIVKVPEYLKGKFKEDAVVMTQHPDYAGQKEQDTIFVSYFGAFLHPDSGLRLPTHDCTNPYYGYALVPPSLIYGEL